MTTAEQANIRRELRLGIPLWFLSLCWGRSEVWLLRIAGLSRAEQEERTAARCRLVQRHPELADLNRAVVAEFPDA